MAVVFDEPVELTLKILIKDIQLKLKGVLCRVSGIILATNRSMAGGYVFLFGKSMTPQIRKKIHSFVHMQLQEQILRI